MSFRIIVVDPAGDVVLDGRSLLHEAAASTEEPAPESEPPTLRSAESGFFPSRMLDGAADSKTNAA